MKRNINKSDVVWFEGDNSNATASAMHAYYPRTRKTKWFGEEYQGVGSLCDSGRFISEDGEHSISIDAVEKHERKPYACKRCQKIFDALPQPPINK